jgi:hypothetical protein
MTISAGSDIVAADFVSTSAGAGDSGKVPKLNASGQLDLSFLRSLVIETTSGTSHSLTTVAGQTVIVWAKGIMGITGGGSGNATLSYNGVQKDIVSGTSNSAVIAVPFSLIYTEVPGAATHNITVAGSVSVSEVVIIVLKI